MPNYKEEILEKRGRKRELIPNDAPESVRKLHEVLIHFGLSNSGLARIIGVKAGETVGAWAKGKTPIPDWAKKMIAHELDVAIEWWDQEGVPIQEAIGKRAKPEEEGFPYAVEKLLDTTRGQELSDVGIGQISQAVELLSQIAGLSKAADILADKLRAILARGDMVEEGGQGQEPERSQASSAPQGGGGKGGGRGATIRKRPIQPDREK